MPPDCRSAAPRSCRRALLLGRYEYVRPVSAYWNACGDADRAVSSGKSWAGLAVLVRLLASRNTPAFPVSLVKRYEKKNGNFWRDPGAFVHDCLVIVSSVSIDFYARIRCVGEQIFLAYNRSQLLPSYGCQISNPKRGKLCLMKFSLHHHVFCIFCFKAKVTV